MTKMTADSGKCGGNTANLSGRTLDPEKIFREIKTMIKGEVLYDDLSRTIYSSAACLFQVKPLGIVLPKDKDDVIQVVK